MNSASNQPNLEALLAHTGRGDAAAREELLGLYRPYLRLVAGQQTPQLVQQRVDASDIVQQTLMDAVRGLPEFRGETEPEFTAWMMRLLERNLLMSVRNNTLAKRDVRLELELDRRQRLGCVDVARRFAADGASPMSSVFRGEAALQLAMALEKLPADQSTAVELRYIEQLQLQEIAVRMERTVGSVAGLIRRGVEALQQLLPAEFGELK